MQTSQKNLYMRDFKEPNPYSILLPKAMIDFTVVIPNPHYPAYA